MYLLQKKASGKLDKQFLQAYNLFTAGLCRGIWRQVHRVLEGKKTYIEIFFHIKFNDQLLPLLKASEPNNTLVFLFSYGKINKHLL